MDISARIIELREKNGYSTNKLAKKAGIGQSTLREIEKGIKQPNTVTLNRICSALNIGLSDFFADASPEQPLEILLILEKIKKLPPQRLEILNAVLDDWISND